jgi:rSAM/selenodomain-associated transferase 1
MKKNAVILFTRIPVAGKTKTRLRPLLSDDECCEIQRAFITDVFDVLQSGLANCDIFVCYSPEGNLDDLMSITKNAKTHFQQEGSDLGEKMYNAFCHVFAIGYERCLLIGSDIPQLKSEHINQALELLKSSDIVLSPTEDGGYYLVGMKEPCKELFKLEEYGISNVFEKTIAAANRAGKSCAVGTMLADVDEPDDLYRLAEALKIEDSNICIETRKVLSEVLPERGEAY